MAESFPCIKCGQVLQRVTDDSEGQPDDGIMCMSYGNYGSTVFDPMDMSYLAFNICDSCVKRLAKAGRLYITRSFSPVTLDGYGLVGRIRAERPYIQWRPGLADDGAGEVELTMNEIEALGDRIQLFIPLERLREFEAEHGLP